jgi:hypothetical protein
LTVTVTGPVTVILNNCNLLAWPRAMVRAIEEFDQLAEILIVDNGSTYEPLLAWYEAVGHPVIRLPNVGHTAPWLPEVKERVKTDLYVVTDPDLDLARTPRDCLRHLAECLARYPAAKKIGLGLEIDDVPPASPYFAHVNRLEKSYWSLAPLPGGVRPAPVDTTFAIYHKALLDEYAVRGGRTDRPYTARHLPWSVIEPDAEFRYYLDHANRSSSYKLFVDA